MPFNLQITIGSTRPGQAGPVIADWVKVIADSLTPFAPEIVDLNDFALPVYDEPKHPLFRDYTHDHTKRWGATVDQADAFFFMTPEHNYDPPASLASALDYLYHEWNYKPAGIMRYGSGSGGLRAAQALKLLLTPLKIMPMAEEIGLLARWTEALATMQIAN